MLNIEIKNTEIGKALALAFEMLAAGHGKHPSNWTPEEEEAVQAKMREREEKMGLGS